MSSKAILLCVVVLLGVQSSPEPVSEVPRLTSELEEGETLVKPSLQPPEEPEAIPLVPYYEYITVAGKTHYVGRLTEEEQKYTYELCLSYDIDFEIMLGLMGVEATWNLDVEDTRGYAGVGQIAVRYYYYPMKARGIDIYDRLENIEGICILLSNLLDIYDDYHKALIAYNCGRGKAEQEYFSKGIYKTGYSRAVFRLADAMKEVRYS